MKKIQLALLIITTVILSGCLGSQRTMVVKDSFAVPKEEILDLTVRPHESLGIRMTPAIKAGRVTVLKDFSISNQIFYAEEHPGRIRWNAWVVTPDGREYFAQIIRVKLNYRRQYEYRAIIDALPEELAGGKIVGLGSLLDFVVDFEGRHSRMDGKEFAKQREYRFAIAAERGTSVEGLKLDNSNFFGIAAKLNVYHLNDEGYELLCEYGEDSLRKIAEINPGYAWSEKFTLTSKGQITMPIVPDPLIIGVGTGLSLGNAMIEFLLSINAKSVGWDYFSGNQTNEVAAFKMMWLDKTSETFIQAMEKKNRSLGEENQALKKKIEELTKNQGTGLVSQVQPKKGAVR